MRILRYILLFVTICLVANMQDVFGQISVNGQSLIEHGSNANEATEYVTVGSTMRYYMMPDENISTGFNPAGDLNSVANNNAIESAFFWSVTPALADPATAVGGVYKSNYVSITWDNTGAGTIESYERSLAGCDGNTVVTNVTVIPAPTVSSVNNIAAITCVTTPINEPVPATISINITSSTPGTPKGFEVSFTLTGPGYSETQNDVAVSDAGDINIAALSLPNLTSSGVYTFTITGISDRISSKCGITPAVISVSKIFYVIPIPVTTKPQHRSNDNY